MAERIIKEGEPMDPIQVGDIITLELKNGKTISEFLAVESCSNNCKHCAMYGTGVKCYDGWAVRNPEKYVEGFDYMALCCTSPVLGPGIEVLPKFCRFIKLDTIMENL
jgi:hypothetical protein